MESEELDENEEVKEDKERKIVVPGETIVSGENYLPGDNVRREGKEIVAERYGLAEESGRLVKIIPLSGIYVPRRGNVVIGEITDVTFNGWLIDIKSPYNSFLSLAECPRFINKNDMQDFMDIGDMCVAKVASVKSKGIDLTIKGRGLGKQEDGLVININSNKVPRVIGREGSMINLIKNETGCDIVVGQNGVVWIKGSNVPEELFAKEAILYVTDKSFLSGLTERVKEWFDEQKKLKGDKK